MIRRLASLHWLQPGAVRQLRRYYQDAMTSCRPSRRTSLPSLGGTSVALVLFAPRRTSAPPRPGVGNPVSPAGMSPRRRQDLPSSWGTSIVRLHMFSRLRQDCSHQTITVQQRGPWYVEQQRLPRKVFRSSIAWLSDWLSTLRSAGYPATTQDSLPAAGQALPDGLSTRRVPTERFQSCFLTSHPPFPSFAWHNHIDRGHFGEFRTCVEPTHRGRFAKTRRACRHRVRLRRDRVIFNWPRMSECRWLANS